MNQVIIGLFLIALGIWGLFDEWYYVLDFIKGSLPLFMIAIGILSILLFVVGPENLKKEQKNE